MVLEFALKLLLHFIHIYLKAQINLSILRSVILAAIGTVYISKKKSNHNIFVMEAPINVW